MSVEMTSRERLWAAINGEPVDRIPVGPRIWRYASWQGCSKLELARRFNFDYFGAGVGELGTPFSDTYCRTVEALLPEVKIDIRRRRQQEQTEVERTFHTQAGELRDVLIQPDPGARYGVAPDPERKEPLVKTEDDVELLKFLLPSPEHVKQNFPSSHELEAQVGDDGLVVFRPTLGVDHIVLESLGPEQAMILSVMDPQMFNRLIEVVDEWHMEVMKLALEDGWKIIFDAFFNFSLSTGWSPDFYRQTVGPIIKRHTDLVHSYGAKMFFYDDGKLANSIDYVVDAGVDIIQTLTPPPIGDLDFRHLAKTHGGKVCFNGGIDTVRMRFGTPKEISDSVSEVIETFAPTGRFILGTSDSIPEHTPEENMRAFFDTARECGAMHTGSRSDAVR